MGMAEYKPRIDHDEGTIGGRYTSQPVGVILHGSRSGVAGRSVEAEYHGTRGYAASGIELGWTCTVGNDAVSLHMTPAHWGWNARGASSRYLAVEFAQPTVAYTITDAQVRAFCWWLQYIALAQWPDLPFHFPMHSELPEGKADGKSDTYLPSDPRADDLRQRIAACLRGEEDDLSAEERAELEQLREVKVYTDALTDVILPSALGTMEAAAAEHPGPLANIVLGQCAAVREQSGL
jgi:hypothetical protein